MSEHYELPDIESAWSNRWWEKPVWRNQLHYSDARINALLELLHRYFGSAWADKYPDHPKHPVYQSLVIGEALHHIRGLINTAEQYERLLGVHGFKRVREAYENPDSWMSANLEMLMAVSVRSTSFHDPGGEKRRTLW